MSHLSQIQTILATLTSKTITVYPADVTVGYVLWPKPDKAVKGINQTFEFFNLVIKSSSLANLETDIALFLNTKSVRPNGYKFTTATNPLYIDVYIDRKQWNIADNECMLIVEGRWPL